MKEQTQVISFVPQGWDVKLFGSTVFLYAYQLFRVDKDLNLRGFIVNVRRNNSGTMQSDICCWLCSTKMDQLPDGKGPYRIPDFPGGILYESFAINSRMTVGMDWQKLNIGGSYKLKPGYYAVVLGQQTPQVDAYEWAVGPQRRDCPFGRGYTPILGYDVPMFVLDRPNPGTAWMEILTDGEGEIIDYMINNSNYIGTGNGFGNSTDEVKRYATFMTTDHSQNITGVDLLVRKIGGNTQSDLTVELYVSNYNSRPVNDRLASATIPASSISSDWTKVHASLMYDGMLPYTMYAIVLGQRNPQPARYEWAVDKISQASFFGKWNGSTWIDESGLGNGCMMLWGHPKNPMTITNENGSVGLGFGNRADEIKRFQTVNVSTCAGKALMGVDLKLRKFNGMTQTDVIVELFLTNKLGMPVDPPLARAVIPSYAVSSDWTIVHAPLWYSDLPAQSIAIVMGQKNPNAARYEWATSSKIPGFEKFGKWNGTAWQDESNLGIGYFKLWIDEPHVVIDTSHLSEIGFGFGNVADEVIRFETVVPTKPIQVKGIQLKLRRRFGSSSSQSDLFVQINKTDQNTMPINYTLATAKVEASLIGESWTIVNVHITTGTINEPFAIILGQCFPQEARYEWAVKEVNSSFRFGKWNGSSYHDESNLGDGWVKVWACT